MNWKIVLALTALLVTALAIKAFAEPLFIGVSDPKICAARGKAAPCQLRCGNLDYKADRKIWVWRGCDGLAKIFAAPVATPVPTASPRPSIGPTPCTGTPCDCGLPGWCATWIPETDTVLCARCPSGQK